MWKEATRVECTGLNLNKWVAKLLRCGYVIRDVEWRDECTLRMTIGVNAAKLFALFENSCYNKTIKMHILSQSGSLAADWQSGAWPVCCFSSGMRRACMRSASS